MLFLLIVYLELKQGTKHLLLSTQKLITTVLKYVHKNCKRRFSESWHLGRNNSRFYKTRIERKSKGWHLKM